VKCKPQPTANVPPIDVFPAYDDSQDPAREGLVCEDVRRTYKDLNDRANRLANAMKAIGIGYGDRVGLLALNEPEFYDIYFGLGKIGRFKIPKSVIFTDTIPRTPTGKILKRVLREEFN
jgi:acyl-CoA synthetase (AMP-forming)/AMP-acid ligase II